MTTKIGNTLRKRWQLCIIAFGTLVMAAGVFVATGSGSAQTPPATVAVATATPVIPTAISTPVEIVKTPPSKPQEQPQRVPLKAFGPITAEPYRVHTGDGDCLNVRPAPSKTFATDPRTCVPEGFLLWLYGEVKEAEGETWRWALGEGWVAMRYVKPDATAKTGFGPMKGVLVTASDGVDTRMATVSADGKVESNGAFAWQPQGLGAILPGISPSGEWYASSMDENYRPTLTIGRVRGGAVVKYPGLHFGSWSPDNKIRVITNETCPQTCGIWGAGWLDPADGIVHRLEGLEQNIYALAWAPDGQSLISVSEKGGVSRVALDGKVTQILAKLPDGFQFGEMSVSPAGGRIGKPLPLIQSPRGTGVTRPG